MKKIQHLLMLLAVFTMIAQNIYSQASDLFFSEYAEGSSFNKYVEISNSTGASVDLSMYQIKKGTNGADFTESMTLTGSLADGDVYIVSRSDADPQIVALADELNGSVINFNGDDVMGLFKNEVLIDIIGMVGDDPGDGWDVAGVLNGTKDHTLVRKPNVCDPITDWPVAAGTNANDSQWIVYDQNFWDELGTHVSDCSGSTTVATPLFSHPGGQYFEAIDVTITCSTADASIFYTLDGSDPDESSNAYTMAINISAATTLKARAYAAGLDPSAIAQADYTFAEYTEVVNLTDLRDSFTGGTEIFVVTGEVVLTFQQDFRGQKYLQDQNAAILVDDDAGIITTQYAIGDGITGITGSLIEYGNMLQFVPAVDPGTPTSSGNLVAPVEITISEMLAGFEDYEARLVKIVNVSFADQGSMFANGTVYQISDDSKAEGSFRSTFYDVDYIGTMIPAGAGEIVGLLNSRTDGNYISSRSLADMMWGTVGEPSNYPAGFAATAAGASISLSWTDATGEILPAGYLILASDQDNISLPVDGTPVVTDNDLSDGSGALNIVSGVQAASFAGLTPDVTYYFKIFPFTNTGASIDFKTDGTPPAAEATAQQSNEVDILFTTFNDGWENWTNFSVTGDQVWSLDDIHGVEGTPCAKMSGYSGGSFENEDWLISPAIDLSNFSNENFSFFSAVGYTGPELQVKVSSDYDGSGNPNDFTWVDFSDQAQWPVAGSFFEWTNSGVLDLSAFTNQTINIAFVFYSTNMESATWELDNIRVAGEGEVVVTPEPTNYPADFAVSASNQTINMSWTDATGEVVPQGYVVMISDQTDITLPADGTPVANDNDVSDGMGAVNVMPGTQAATFSSLMANTSYYAIIIPYTNSGSLIDYKTDGIPPTGSATTGEPGFTVLYTTFNESWENWTAVSIVGDQVWDRNNTYGLESTPCARMSGYSGASFANEDWLISPAIDLSLTTGEEMSFYSALGYTGPGLKLLISTSYDGSGNPTDFGWDDLTSQAAWPAGGTFFEFTASGSINLSSYTNEIIYIAFAYTSNATESATWEVDDIRVLASGAGIGETQKPLSVNLYPNPGNGILNFNAEEPVNSIEVYNLLGMMVYTLDNPGFAGKIDLTNFEKGIYMVRLSATNKIITKRIVVQ
ncbi:MAG: choice-of-anchor J domain-containing protein [Bacteroidales bacterium]|nr:choice-of-anchor J domain-containing protein [Bacteroidales bacterium]